MRMIASGETPTTQSIDTEREALRIIGSALGKMPTTNKEWTFLHIIAYDIQFTRDLDKELAAYNYVKSKKIIYLDPADEVNKLVDDNKNVPAMYALFWRVVHAFAYSGVEY